MFRSLYKHDFKYNSRSTLNYLIMISDQLTGVVDQLNQL